MALIRLILAALALVCAGAVSAQPVGRGNMPLAAAPAPAAPYDLVQAPPRVPALWNPAALSWTDLSQSATSVGCPNTSGVGTVAVGASTTTVPVTGSTSLCDGHAYSSCEGFEAGLSVNLDFGGVNHPKNLVIYGGRVVSIPKGASFVLTANSAGEVLSWKGQSVAGYAAGMLLDDRGNVGNEQDAVDVSGAMSRCPVATFTADFTSGSPTLTNVSSCAGIVNGMATSTPAGFLADDEIADISSCAGSATILLTRAPIASHTAVSISVFKNYAPDYQFEDMLTIGFCGNNDAGHTHSDRLQTQGRVGQLRIDRWTHWTSYQGDFTHQAPMSGLLERRSDITWTACPWGPETNDTDTLLESYHSLIASNYHQYETYFPIGLRAVYVQPPLNGTPLATQHLAPGGNGYDAGTKPYPTAGGLVCFPRAAMNMIDENCIRYGSPPVPGGHFVNAGNVGLNYKPRAHLGY